MLVVQAVRSAVLWIVEPGSEYVAPAGPVLVLRPSTRPVVASVVLLVAGIASAALARLVAFLAFADGTGGAVVAYGPGAPPSCS